MWITQDLDGTYKLWYNMSPVKDDSIWFSNKELPKIISEASLKNEYRWIYDKVKWENDIPYFYEGY